MMEGAMGGRGRIDVHTVLGFVFGVMVLCGRFLNVS
jgi:hypothetical protein